MIKLISHRHLLAISVRKILQSAVTSHKNRPDPSGSYVSVSFRFESKFESKVESEVKKGTHIRTKLNENEYESEKKNESGGTFEGGAKLPHVGCFTRFVFVFAFVFVFVELGSYMSVFFSGSYVR